MLEVWLTSSPELYAGIFDEARLIAQLDIRTFHDADDFWTLLNDRFDLNISYFSDEWVNSDLVSVVVTGDMFGTIGNASIREWVSGLFEQAVEHQTGMLFVCD